MIIRGKELAQELREAVKAKIENLNLSYRPILCDIVIGIDPVSLSYVGVKGKAAESVGMEFRLIQLPEQSTTEQVLAAIHTIQMEPALCGLIIQLPVPEHINKDTVLNAILPQVDVDCIGRQNNNAFYNGSGVVVPPTAGAIWYILNQVFTLSGQTMANKKFAVIGQGELVGKPTAFLLQKNGLDVVTIDRSTANIASVIRDCDVVISGTGIAGLITGDMIKSKTIVIDAGTSESGAGIVGDVDLASVEPVASYVSPVPGGVGPVTVAKLLENVADVAETKN